MFFFVKCNIIKMETKSTNILWECQICNESQNYPMLSISCGHSVCQSCSEKLQTCPECRKNINQWIPNWELGKLLGLIHEKKINKKTSDVWEKWYNNHLLMIDVIQTAILKRLKSRTTKFPGYKTYVITLKKENLTILLNNALEMETVYQDNLIKEKLILIRDLWENSGEPWIISNILLDESLDFQLDIKINDKFRKSYNLE